MQKTTVRLSGIIGLALLAVGTGQGKQMDAAPDVTVCLRNSIVATPGSVERAKMLARNMFAAAGINIVWRSPGSETSSGIVVDVTLDSGEPADHLTSRGSGRSLHGFWRLPVE